MAGWSCFDLPSANEDPAQRLTQKSAKTTPCKVECSARGTRAAPRPGTSRVGIGFISCPRLLSGSHDRSTKTVRQRLDISIVKILYGDLDPKLLTPINRSNSSGHRKRTCPGFRLRSSAASGLRSERHRRAASILTPSLSPVSEVQAFLRSYRISTATRSGRSARSSSRVRSTCCTPSRRNRKQESRRRKQRSTRSSPG